MAVLKKIKRAIRGDVKLTTLLREVLRRRVVSVGQFKERAMVARNQTKPALLTETYSQMKPEDLVSYFRRDREAHFLTGFHHRGTEAIHRLLFPKQTDELINSANRIVDGHCWPLMGFAEKCFDHRDTESTDVAQRREIQWRRDPLSGYVWPLDYHRDISFRREDGSDVRVVWELNRLGHFITLARAYSLTNRARYSAEFFSQLQSWDEQNPYGRGPNWTCAMEVALRAMNLLGAFQAFRHSPQFDVESMSRLLRMFEEHGNYIGRNLEFSYLATSNHYLSDVAGWVWLGLMFRHELAAADIWEEVGVMELSGELEKQVLVDGADFESSTGYHRFVAELFLYSFLLSEINDEGPAKVEWDRLHQMFIYMRSYLRPDGFAPLIGDTDSGQVFPICRRRADDHGYLLALGAVVFKDPGLKLEGMAPPEELFWILGEEGVKAFQEMNASRVYAVSKAFPNAGTYIMRDRDLYLCFNASDAGINGRGSHGHNDALSIEVSASGHAFIVDPGTYVYSADLDKRHEFRSTAYHSTVRIDGVEQNTTDRDLPFVIGNEAKPRVLEWQTGDDFDKVVAEHYGYMRLAQPVTHRRSVTLNKRERSWLIEDEFNGQGEHVYELRFHFAPEATVQVSGSSIEARIGEALLTVTSEGAPILESQPVSRDYGHMSDAISACWSTRLKRVRTVIQA